MLTDYGVNWDSKNHYNLGEIDFSQYDKVIVHSYQYEYFYDAL